MMVAMQPLKSLACLVQLRTRYFQPLFHVCETLANLFLVQLGIADWLTAQGHEFVVSSDKEGPNSVFQKEIVDVCLVLSDSLQVTF